MGHEREESKYTSVENGNNRPEGALLRPAAGTSRRELPKKIFLALGGIAAALLLIEILLRLTGNIYYDRRLRAEQGVKKEDRDWIAKKLKAGGSDGDTRGDTVRIVCVGDSHTFGLGAEPGFSYPAQLQKLLDTEGFRSSRVYNCGVPSMTTIRLREQLPYILEKYHPQIVLILIGMNDINNPFVSDLYDVMKRGNTNLLGRIAETLSRLKSYKLFEYVHSGIKKRITESRLKKVAPSVRSTSQSYMNKAQESLLRGDVIAMKRYLQMVEQIDPRNEVMYLLRSGYYQGQKRFAESLEACSKLIEINPYSEFRKQLYQQLFLLYQHYPEREKINRVVGAIPSDAAFQVPGRPFLLSESPEVLGMFEKNIDAIIAMVRENSAVPVVLTYAGGSGPLDNKFHAAARKHGIELVDVEREFEGMADPGSYFSLDGTHPNREGYGLVARKVYACIERVIRKNYPEFSKQRQ